MEVTLADLLEGIRERKRLLGIVDTAERTEELRNRGTRRTSRKRELLARIEARAREAGIEPPKGYY
ncbi:MAG TPA: hypothetical protein VF503_06225 [Sphingobium sp.]|uniref:hypothetical protein n=1 Tax=Sphingobium sp. TaxID=1912891 RepID=UPI002ED4871B